jgi:hypothetical protein
MMILFIYPFQKKTIDKTKRSGFTIKGRLFYTYVEKITSNYQCDLECLIGNSFYPDGFNEDALSTFQVIAKPNDPFIYIYSLSDFLYQALSITMPSLNVSDSFLNILFQLRDIIAELDITGSKIFKFHKNQLFTPCIYITTIVGSPVYNSMNQSKSQNGNNNFLNVYTWCATSDSDKIYFGTLDIRSLIYNYLIQILIFIFPDITNLYNILYSLPEDIIILITEILLNKYLSLPINIEDKKLYFDVFSIDSLNQMEIITRSGFNSFPNMNSYSQEGCRQLHIINNVKGCYLMIGTTCYKEDNYAKTYLYKLKERG